MEGYIPKDVLGSVKFIKWQQLYEYEKPFQIFINPPKEAVDQRTTNLVYDDKNILIHDIRGKEKDFKLDEQGFAYCHYDLNFDNFEDFQAVEDFYLPEVERIIKMEVNGADKVFFFDWRVKITIIVFSR